jgi:hypothetical protein
MATVIALGSPDISAIVTASLSGTATGLLALAGTPAGAAVGTVDYGAVGGAVGVGQASAWQLAVGVGQASTPAHPATSAWDSVAAAAPAAAAPVGKLGNPIR